MNKTNKYKTQETLCYSFLSAWVIGIILIMITSSCSTTSELTYQYHYKNYPCAFTK